MSTKFFLLFSVIMAQALSGCITTEEFCGDVLEFQSSLSKEDKMAIFVLAQLPCEKAGPNQAGLMCYVVKSSAVAVKGTMNLCLGYAFASCEEDSNEEMCDELEKVKEFVIGVWEDGNDYNIGDEKEELQDFNMVSYIVEDDLSNVSWEFTIDEEGNIYHFF